MRASVRTSGGTVELDLEMEEVVGEGEEFEVAPVTVELPRVVAAAASGATVVAVVDRRPVGTASLVNPGGGYAVRLPPGTHAVTLAFAGGAGSGGRPRLLLVGAAAAVLLLVAGGRGVARLRRR